MLISFTGRMSSVTTRLGKLGEMTFSGICWFRETLFRGISSSTHSMSVEVPPSLDNYEFNVELPLSTFRVSLAL